MRYILVAIHDRAVNAYQPVHSVRAEGEAIRGFQDALNDKNNRQLNQHPEDFDLYTIGYMDDQTGKLEPLDEPRQLASGKSLTMQASGLRMTAG